MRKNFLHSFDDTKKLLLKFKKNTLKMLSTTCMGPLFMVKQSKSASPRKIHGLTTIAITTGKGLYIVFLLFRLISWFNYDLELEWTMTVMVTTKDSGLHQDRTPHQEIAFLHHVSHLDSQLMISANWQTLGRRARFQLITSLRQLSQSVVDLRYENKFCALKVRCLLS